MDQLSMITVYMNFQFRRYSSPLILDSWGFSQHLIEMRQNGLHDGNRK